MIQRANLAGYTIDFLPGKIDTRGEQSNAPFPSMFGVLFSYENITNPMVLSESIFNDRLPKLVLIDFAHLFNVKGGISRIDINELVSARDEWLSRLPRDKEVEERGQRVVDLINAYRVKEHALADSFPLVLLEIRKPWTIVEPPAKPIEEEAGLSIAELTEKLNILGFTDIISLDYKGRRRQPLINKIKELKQKNC